ncbi:MAG: transporter permease [Sphingobacteriales bacterium]|nr:transporter permease [Sphingobacteriales bacterium]
MDFYLTAILQSLCFAGIALGIFISMKIFKIPDITTDGSYTLGAVITGTLLSHKLPVLATYPIIMISGAVAGALTGLIHTKLKVNALLSGIIVMTGLYSINLTILGRSNLPLLDVETVYGFTNWSTNSILNSLFLLLIFTSLLISIVGYLLKTDFGLAMRATGNSETMIRALGVNTDRMKIIGLAISNSLVATSGFLMGQLQGFVDISMGIGIVIVGLGSVIIAETIINWLNITSVWFSLLIVVFGAVIFQLVLAFTLSVGIDATLLKLVTSVFVLLIVSLPRISFNKAV